jgi:hypothetical protein
LLDGVVPPSGEASPGAGSHSILPDITHEAERAADLPDERCAAALSPMARRALTLLVSASSEMDRPCQPR